MVKPIWNLKLDTYEAKTHILCGINMVDTKNNNSKDERLKPHATSTTWYRASTCAVLKVPDENLASDLTATIMCSQLICIQHTQSQGFQLQFGGSNQG